MFKVSVPGVGGEEEREGDVCVDIEESRSRCLEGGAEG